MVNYAVLIGIEDVSVYIALLSEEWFFLTIGIMGETSHILYVMKKMYFPSVMVKKG